MVLITTQSGVGETGCVDEVYRGFTQPIGGNGAATWFKVTLTDNTEPTVMPLDQGPGADAVEDEMKAISSGLSDARSHYEITDPLPDDHPGGDHPPGPTPTALAELLQIPTMSSMGVILLILCLGAMLSRIGRRRS